MNIPYHFHSAARKLASSCLAAALLLLLSAAVALAQPPDVKPGGSNPILFLPNDLVPVTPKPPAGLAGRNPILFLPLVNGSGDNAALDIDAAGMSAPAPIKLLVDTDPGVDDAVALNWLLTQRSQPVQILGVVSVAGNASITNTTNNAIWLLSSLGFQDRTNPAKYVPVIMGASAPRGGPLSKTPYFVHGPDGLWGLGWDHPQDLSNVPNNAAGFYCSTVGANPGAYLLTLGPLTNIAQAVQKCPDTMKTLGKLVILGGGRNGGGQTPVAEYNIWQDPKSAEIVLGSGLPISLVLWDAFSQPTVDMYALQQLFTNGTASIRSLERAILRYTGVQLANTESANIPDAVAAVLAFQPSQGTQQSALVEVVTEQSPARGQTLVGLTVPERVTMIPSDHELSILAERAVTDPSFGLEQLQQALGAILMSAPDNAQAFTWADPKLLTEVVFPGLYAQP